MTFYGLERPVDYGRQQIFDPTTANMVLQAQAAYADALQKEYYRNLAEQKEFQEKYNDFYTPIMKDQAWVQNNFIDKMRNAVDAMYEQGINPLTNKEAMMELERIRRGLDYGTFAQIKANAKTAEKYLDSMQKLQAAGLYNPELARYEGKGLDQFSTADDGVWDRLSPTPYQNMADFSKAYFDNITPTERAARRNGIDYTVSEITDADLYDIANRHFNDLVSTPQGQLMYKRFKDQLGSDEAARAAFNDAVVAGNLDRRKYSDNYDEMRYKQEGINLERQKITLSKQRNNIEMQKLALKRQQQELQRWTTRQKNNIANNAKLHINDIERLERLRTESTFNGARQALISEGVTKPTMTQVKARQEASKKALGYYGMDDASRELYANYYNAQSTVPQGADHATALAIAAGYTSPEQAGDMESIKRKPVSFGKDSNLTLTSQRQIAYGNANLTKGSASTKLLAYMKEKGIKGHIVNEDNLSVNRKELFDGVSNWDVNVTVRIKKSDLAGFNGNLDAAIKEAGGTSSVENAKGTSNGSIKYGGSEYVYLPVTRTVDSHTWTDMQIDSMHDASQLTKSYAAKTQSQYANEDIDYDW